MINHTLKEFLLYDVSKANSVDDLKVILDRLIASMPTDEDYKEKFVSALTKAMK